MHNIIEIKNTHPVTFKAPFNVISLVPLLVSEVTKLETAKLFTVMLLTPEISMETERFDAAGIPKEA